MTLDLQCKKIIDTLQISWQYPVITELTVYNQKKKKKNQKYIGIPWATIIDKRLDLNNVLQVIKKYIIIESNVHEYTTCCQHVSYKLLIPLFKHLGIKHVYTSHKIIGLDMLNNIHLYPLPLYAANIEDSSRNTLYKTLTAYSETVHSHLLCKKREYLYCFMGAYDSRWYLTSIRNKIFTLKHPSNTFIKNTKTWHFENIVYGKQIQKRSFNEEEEKRNKIKLNIYNTILASSRFSLCPSGTGPNSIRFWESLGFGSIPILLADTLDLPPHPLWDTSIIRIPENMVGNINTILSNISSEKENSMRKNCLLLYDDFKDSFIINERR